MIKAHKNLYYLYCLKGLYEPVLCVSFNIVLARLKENDLMLFSHISLDISKPFLPKYFLNFFYLFVKQVLVSDSWKFGCLARMEDREGAPAPATAVSEIIH